GSVARTNLAHVLSDQRVDPAFHPDPNDTVAALALQNGKLFVGGDFSNIGGQPRSRIAALDSASGAVLPWGPEANGTVSVLLVADEKVYAGGYFTSIGGQPRNRVAVLDANSGNALPWNPDADGAVLTLAL